MALVFQIDLGGNFVDALDKSNKKLEETDKDTHKAAEGVKFFEGEIGHLGTSLGGLEVNFSALAHGGSIFTFDLAEGLHVALELVHKLVEGFVDLGKEMVVTAGKEEDLNLAIKLDVGEEGLEKVESLAESFKGTAFGPSEIKKYLLPILEESGDEHSAQWDDLVTAATDVATRKNTGAAGAQAALQALRGIEIQPQKIRGALKELGIKQVDFYDDLGSLLGISAKTAEKQTKAGKIKAETLLSVALNQIAEREGGQLGTATNEGSKTLGASIARLSRVKEDLFEGLAGSEGLKKFQGAVDNFVDTLSGPVGKELVTELSNAFGMMFEDFSGPDGAKKVEEALRSLKESAVVFIHDFRDGWPSIKEAAVGVWDVLKAIGETIATIVRGWKQLAEVNDLLHGTGFVGGFATDKVNENSPAWKKVPKMADGGLVDKPTLALIGEAGPEAVVPLGRRGRSPLGEMGGISGDMSFGDINVAVDARGATASDASAIGAATGEAVRIELKKILQEARAA